MTSRRHVTDTGQRTKFDFPQQIKESVDVHYPEVERIVLVMYNLNPHTPESHFATFPPHKARRLTDKPELHCIP